MTESITIQESARLVELEEVIERGVSTFIKVGEALAEIRDKRLYRLEYETFEDYCRDEWQISKRHCDRLIGAAAVIENLGPIGPIQPKTESQTRPLASLEPEQQREAWTAAVEASNGKPTAKHVEAAVEVVKERSIRPIPEYAPSPEASVRITEAEKDSETLWSLKSYWRKATKKDRAAFLVWSENN